MFANPDRVALHGFDKRASTAGRCRPTRPLEGNTLVADVTSFSDSTWLDAAGNYHSDELHVVERYTRTSPDILMYEATIEDPKVFTRPWRIRMPLRLQKGIQVVEDECEEGENGRRHHMPLFKQAP